MSITSGVFLLFFITILSAMYTGTSPSLSRGYLEAVNEVFLEFKRASVTRLVSISLTSLVFSDLHNSFYIV